MPVLHPSRAVVSTAPLPRHNTTYCCLDSRMPPVDKPPAVAPINCKLLLIGNSSVGKSSLLLRFSEEQWLPEDESSATIGVDFCVSWCILQFRHFFRGGVDRRFRFLYGKVHKMTVKGKKVKLSIWVRLGNLVCLWKHFS